MGKIITYISTSADGYIARPDGSFDWLNRPRPAGASWWRPARDPAEPKSPQDTLLLQMPTSEAARFQPDSSGVAHSPEINLRAGARPPQAPLPRLCDTAAGI
jgi:hypothetical protein